MRFYSGRKPEQSLCITFSKGGCVYDQRQHKRFINCQPDITDKIRAYTETMELAEAVDRAINECIEEDILRDFLMEHKAEARAMSIFEYDQERHMQQEREAGIEKGERQLLRRQVQKKLAKGMNISDIAEALEETEERIREIAAEVAGEQKE